MITFETIKGDITKIKADCSVNAANTIMMGGDGVDGALHRAAGKQLKNYIEMTYRSGLEPNEPAVKTGQVIHTPSFGLQDICHSIFHVAGPDCRILDEDQAFDSLVETYKNIAITIMKWNDHYLQTNDREKLINEITIPAISTGIYGMEALMSSCVAITTLNEILGDYERKVKVIFVLFNDYLKKIYDKVLFYSE